MKKILAIILAAVSALTVFSACGEQPKDDGTEKQVQVKVNQHTLYIRSDDNIEEMTANFINSDSGKTEEVAMKKQKHEGKGCTFSCEGDVDTYNKVFINYDGLVTEEFAFNECVSGWNLSGKRGLTPYTEGEKIDEQPKYDTVKLPGLGYYENIYIWKPADYNAKSKEKYATIYMFDGIINYVPVNGSLSDTCWNVTEHVKSMIKETGFKAIVVALDNGGNEKKEIARDDLLIPNLGKMAAQERSTKKLGQQYANFITQKVVPYIRKNYNVYTDARHTAIAGSSLGGLEAFYVGMEHPDIFGTVGALSPSFWTYKEQTWRKYVEAKLANQKFAQNTPYIYLYSGGNNGDTGKETKMMAKVMRNLSYPKNKMAFDFFKNGSHIIPCWRDIYPEFLQAMVHQKITPLQ